MSLNLDLLERVHYHGDKVTAACPVCREDGYDSQGVHLVCFGPDGDGPFKCIRGCDTKEIWRLVGARDGNTGTKNPSPPRPTRPRKLYEPYPDEPEEKLFVQLIQLRCWPPTAIRGLQLMNERGLLHFEQVYDAGRSHRSWVISDRSRLNAQARKLNGERWKGIGNAKAKTVPGIPDARWPIGAADIGKRPLVVLCEGQPDFCAVLPLALDEELDPDLVAPVCMTGANHSISDDAGAHFTGKTVLIPYHSDPSGIGETAAIRWTSQLYAYGTYQVITVACGELIARKTQIKDLADFLSIEGRTVKLLRPVFDMCADGKKLE